jgi:hypothetical protein
MLPLQHCQVLCRYMDNYYKRNVKKSSFIISVGKLSTNKELYLFLKLDQNYVKYYLGI